MPNRSTPSAAQHPSSGWSVLARAAGLMAMLLCAFILVRPAAASERVIALGGEVAEIIYALGAEDRLVATDTTSVYPPAALETPKVGYVRSLSAEGVLSLDPDLIIVSGAAGPDTAVEQLSASGVRFIELPQLFTIQSIIDKTRVIAAELGLEAKGEQLVTQIETDWAEAKAEISALPDSPRALFFFAAGDGAPRAAGTRTAAHAAMTLAGAQNVFTEHEGIKSFSFEASVEKDPDVILIMAHHAGSDERLEAIATHPALSLTRAAQNRHIIRVDGPTVMQFGPRTPKALAVLARDLRSPAEAAQRTLGQ